MNRIYIAGPPDHEDFHATRMALMEKGWVVANDRTGGDLRTQVGVLITCDSLCLLDTWWTDANAHHLQLLASGLRMTSNYAGTLVGADDG